MASDEKDQDPGQNWLLRYVVPSVVLAFSVLWFIQDRSYEPAITLVTSAAVLGGVLLSKGRVAVGFIGGFVLGGALATFVVQESFHTAPDSKHLVSDLSAKDLEISDLRKQNAELTRELARSQELLRSKFREVTECQSQQEKTTPSRAQLREYELAKSIVGVWRFLRNENTWEFTPGGTFVNNPGFHGKYRILGEDLVEIEGLGLRATWSITINGNRAIFVTPPRLESGSRIEMQRVYPRP